MKLKTFWTEELLMQICFHCLSASGLSSILLCQSRFIKENSVSNPLWVKKEEEEDITKHPAAERERERETDRQRHR